MHISIMLAQQAVVGKGCCCMDHGTVWRWAECVLLWINTAVHLASKLIQAPCLCTAAWFLLYSVKGLLLHRPGQCVVMGCICPAVGLHCSTLGLQLYSGTMPVHISMMPDHHAMVRRGYSCKNHGTVWSWAASVLLCVYTARHLGGRHHACAQLHGS